MPEVVRTIEPVELTVSASKLAEWFALLNDDQQAQFFEHVAREFDRFEGGGSDMQKHRIGRHLVECECTSKRRGLEWLQYVVESATWKEPESDRERAGEDGE